MPSITNARNSRHTPSNPMRYNIMVVQRAGLETEVMLTFIVLLGILAFVAWPYAVVYRLNRAVMANDRHELERLLDLDAIRQHLKQQLDQNIEDSTEQLDNLVVSFLRGGVKEIGAISLESIDAEWVQAVIRAAHQNSKAPRQGWLGCFSFACFDRPTRFLVRAGELGQHPVHLYLALRHGQWRVSGVFI
jgi:hypothetical protein